MRRKLMCQEAIEMYGEVGGRDERAFRAMTSPNAAFARAVTSGNSSAVRWRYRWVPARDR